MTKHPTAVSGPPVQLIDLALLARVSAGYAGRLVQIGNRHYWCVPREGGGRDCTPM